MQNMKAALTTGQSDLANRPVFNVVLAHDEYAGGIRAKELFDALVRDHGELFQFICHLRKFEVLPEQRLFDVAAQDTARADEANELDDAATAEPFGEIPRGIDKWLWFVEAHSQAPK
jgi:hypothetical protein